MKPHAFAIRNGIVVRPASGPAARRCTRCGWSAPIVDREGVCTACAVRETERAICEREGIVSSATRPEALAADAVARATRREAVDEELRKLRAQVATLTAERDAYVSTATQLRSLARLVAVQGEEVDRLARVVVELRQALSVTHVVMADMINAQDTP